MPGSMTPNLGLIQIVDGDTNWGDDYRANQDVLDAHPGLRVVTDPTQRPPLPFDGQVISRPDQPGVLEQFSAVDGQWHALAGEGGAGVTTVTGTAAFGQAPVPTGTAAPLVTVTAPANWRCDGFSATGDGDGYFTLLIDGATVLTGRIRFAQPSIAVTFPAPVPVSAGLTVVLRVSSESSVTCTYDGTIYGEIDG